MRAGAAGSEQHCLPSRRLTQCVSPLRLSRLCMRPPACPTALQATELAEALSRAQSGAATCTSIRDTAFPLVLRFTSTGLIELWLVRARPCMHYIRSPRSWQPCAVLAAGCCCCCWWWWWWWW